MNSYICNVCKRAISVTQWRNHVRGDKHQIAAFKQYDEMKRKEARAAKRRAT